MYSCTNSFPLPAPLAQLTLLAAVFVVSALDVRAQTPADNGPLQLISFTDARPCAVEATGEVTALVKNGVELSVTEDWDCDGIADAYDNCVGMANAEQADRDGDRIGDVCEAATIIKVPPAAKEPPSAKTKTAKADAPTVNSRKAGSRSGNSETKGRGRRREDRNAKAKSPESKAKGRVAKAVDRRGRSRGKKRL